MSAKESQSLPFNHISWSISHLAENVLLLQAKGISIEQVHASTHLAKKLLGSLLTDIVPSYDSVALFHNSQEEVILGKLASQYDYEEGGGSIQAKIVVSICYELGADLEDVAKQVNLSQAELISRHLSSTYKAILIGFTPGFIYMDGLDEALSCPRRASPRKYLEAGSVGIGGNQTGIYSLNSPGGWNIIGRTPIPLFDIGKQPPMSIEIGAEIEFERISQTEFEAWGN